MAITQTITIVLMLFASIAYSQSVLFQKVFGGMGSDWGYSVIQSKDGGYVIAGKTDSYSPNDYAYLIKADSLGDTLWTRRIGSASAEQYASSIQETTDGGFIIAGGISGSTGYDVLLIKTDSNGFSQWIKILVENGKKEGLASIKQTNDGGYIATGFDEINGTDVYLIKTDANGDTLWTKRYGGTNAEIGNSVDITSDGGYIIAGDFFDYSSSKFDAYLIRTDSNGDSLWTRVYGGTKDDKGNSVRVTSDGGFIICGSTQSFGVSWTNGNGYLIKTDSSGDTIWTRAISRNNSAGSGFLSLVISSDGGYTLSGVHGDSILKNSMYLVKTNSNGDTLWTRTFGGTGYEDGRCLQQTTDGGFIIVGLTDSYGPLYNNIYLVKTDSLGNSIDYDNGIFNYEEAKKEIKIYPNPFNIQANLILPPEIDVSDKPLLRVYDIYGNETARVTITSHRALITRDNLASGLYFCEAVKGNTVIATGKFIIQ